MDKVILNGNKARFYNEGNTQSGSIQYTNSKLSINSMGGGVLFTDGKLYLKSGTSTSSITYDASTEGVQFPDGLVIIGSGSTPGGLKFQDTTLYIYTHSSVTGDLHVQGSLYADGGIYTLGISAQGSIYAFGEIETPDKLKGGWLNITNTASFGGDITSSGAKIGSGTGYVSSSAGVYSTKGGRDVMDDLGAYRYITLNGTTNEISVSPISQNLASNRTWTIGLPNDVKITNNLTIGDNVASDVFSSGFTGNGWIISKSTALPTKYTAVFDDLWVRGSMNVYEMVINQIRATNGSLWISDASKATSASYDSTNQRIVLRFQTGSLVPFIAGDILRSKRWGLSGSTTQSVWDISTTVSAVNYAQAYVTISAPTNGVGNLYTYTSSANGTWAQFVSKISNSGSQWVRVGNITNGDRKGSIYITSNDFGGPFIDVYDEVSSSVQATSGASQSVNTTKVKTRVGKLSGIVDSAWGQLSGYGLYSDNVYLKGTISATAGTFSGKVTANEGQIGGWTISQTNLSSSGITLQAGSKPSIKIGNASAFNTGTGIFMSGSSNTSYLRVGQTSGSGNTYLLWNGSNLSWQTPNFTMSTAGTMTLTGSINATSGNFTGQVNAGSGTIGGWTISSGLYAADQDWSVWIAPTQISFYNISDYLLIGTNSNYFNGSGIGYFPYGDSLNPYFKVDRDGAFLSGTITSSAGLIGGWNINSGGISSIHSYGTVSITKSGISNLSLTDTYGNFTYSAANSNLYSSSVNKYLVDRASTLTDFNRYETGITISQANQDLGFGFQINHLFDNIVPLFVFTVSGLTIDKEYILQSRLQNLAISGIGTPTLADHSSIYCWVTPTTNPWNSMELLGQGNPLWRASAESNNLVKQYRITPTTTKIYLWVGGTIAPMDSNFSKVAKFTFSGFRIDSFKQYTELSQKGLLVFNSPENYLQLSSENDYLTNSSKGSLGLLNVTELHVNGTSINDRINNPISVFNGGTGTNSFANHQFLWYDSESKMITASGFSSSSGGGSGMTDYPGVLLGGANVISYINIASGVMTTASRTLAAADISAAVTFTKVVGKGLLDGGGTLAEDIAITHKTVNGAYHLPVNGSAGQILVNSSDGSGSWGNATFSVNTHGHGNITEGGKIGNVPGLMIKTGNNGLLYALDAGSSGQYLRYDGTWDTPAGTYTHPPLYHLPVNGSPGQVLVNNSDGSGSWSDVILKSSNLSTRQFLWYFNNKITNSSFNNESFASSGHSHTTYVSKNGDTMTGDLNLTDHCITVSSLHGDNNNFIYASDYLCICDVDISSYISFGPAGDSQMVGFAVDSCNIEASTIYSSNIQYSTTTRARTAISNSTVGNAFTVSNTMVGQYNRFSSSATITIHIQTQSALANYKIDTGSVITLFQAGTGIITVTTEDNNVTLSSYNNGTKTYGLYSSMQLINVSHNTWDLIGAVS